MSLHKIEICTKVAKRLDLRWAIFLITCLSKVLVKTAVFTHSEIKISPLQLAWANLFLYTVTFSNHSTLKIDIPYNFKFVTYIRAHNMKSLFIVQNLLNCV